MSLSDRYFGEIIREAQALVAEERKSNPDTSKFDFTSTVACVHCMKMIDLDHGKKALTCSKCKSPMYCSRECGTAHWTASPQGAQTHQQLCADNQRHMLRLPETQAIVKQFPWGRLEKDGTFNEEVARGRFKVLGTSKKGFWSQRGGPVPHATQGGFESHTNDPMIRQMIKAFNHLDGLDLLDEKHLSDEDGWKLQSRLIPFRTFTVIREPPLRAGSPKATEVKDWKSWHEWRRLPMDSPAAILMHYPLTTYWLLGHTLKLTNPQAGSVLDRKSLVIHYIGAEAELNFLPIFSELALLLPYHDIHLIMFGSVEPLLEQGRKKPRSLVAKSSPTSPIFQYTAPKESGSSTLSIYLHKSPAWTPADATSSSSVYSHLYQSNSSSSSRPDGPDTIIALNAGLGAYAAWHPVIVWTLATNTPFAVTDYSEQSCETQQAHFLPLLNRQGRIPGSICSGPGAPTSEQCAKAIIAIDEKTKSGKNMGAAFPIELNPFQRPGQRTIPFKLPNVPNGFTQRVVWRGE